MGTEAQYVVLRGTDIEELESLANLWFSKGYEPAGGVAVETSVFDDAHGTTYSHNYLQAMRLRAV